MSAKIRIMGVRSKNVFTQKKKNSTKNFGKFQKSLKWADVQIALEHHAGCLKNQTFTNTQIYELVDFLFLIFHYYLCYNHCKLNLKVLLESISEAFEQIPKSAKIL